MTLTRLRRLVASRMKRHALSGRGLLRSIGLPEGHGYELGLFLRGERPPKDALLRALGYRRVPKDHYERMK